MTSNLGSRIIKEFSQDYEVLEREVRKELESQFRPEFLNRVDEIVIFRGLTKDAILQIVDLQIELLKKRLADRGVGLEVTRRARELIAERGYDPVYGARPLKRTVQHDIQNPLARRLLAGEFSEGDTVKADVSDQGQFVFSKKKD